MRITSINDSGDMRGSVFHSPRRCIEFLGTAVDFSIMTLTPAHVRGNHFHRHTREVLVVVHQDRWSLHWDTGENTQVCTQQFSGIGVEMIEIEPLWSHAVRNNGNQDLYIVHILDTKYDQEKPDAVPRTVVR